mmetsp:Transcript_44363/g.138146  ORF Transcript_44363/g.138146 Transcript_44363/m.138146 type:complete len:81 (+) Transcript_44363:1-243(+)
MALAVEPIASVDMARPGHPPSASPSFGDSGDPRWAFGGPLQASPSFAGSEDSRWDPPGLRAKVDALASRVASTLNTPQMQ